MGCGLPHDHGGDERRVLERMPKEESFRAVAGAFRLMDDPSRIRIFWLLCHCEECVINLSAMVQMSSPAVSHHLRQLKAGGLIVSRREGQEVYYRAADTPQSQMLHIAVERMMELTCPGGARPCQKRAGPRACAYRAPETGGKLGGCRVCRERTK